MENVFKVRNPWGALLTRGPEDTTPYGTTGIIDVVTEVTEEVSWFSSSSEHVHSDQASRIDINAALWGKDMNPGLQISERLIVVKMKGKHERSGSPSASH